MQRMHPAPFNPAHTVSDWPHCFLELGCPGCGKTTIVALRMLVRDYGREQVLDVVKRFRCDKCGVAPAPVHLCASANRIPLGGGHRPDWAVQLVAVSGREVL